jgi:hypothetical protein
MVTELRVYFEGDSQLKPGIHSFMKEIVDIAREKRCRFRPIATGSKPLEDFYIGLKANPDASNVLLLDSDCSIECSLPDFCISKKIDPLHEGSVFWMVQIMESWFLPDIDALKRFAVVPLAETNS